MKQFLIIFSLLLSCLCMPQYAYCVTGTLTQEQALRLAKLQMQNRNCNYYSFNDGSSLYWNFFIDAEPGANWEHECYIFAVNKNLSSSGTPVTRLIARKFPPGNPMTLISQESSQNDIAMDTTKPTVLSFAPDISTSDEITDHTYALIISGGGNPQSNYERYWNDCSFIYQSLTKRYKIPKSNIYPIMSDGDNPEPDMNPYPYSYSSYVSQNLDLDGDGENEIKLPATKESIINTLNTIKTKITKNDHLFIFVIDHGGSDDNNTSYICLWNEKKIYDYELANLLAPFTKASANVNVVLGQCKAGGFIDNLQDIGCVVSAACEANANSYACIDKCYDEFVYHWTCAVNKANHKGKYIYALSDRKAPVTMKTAFDYAVSMDTRRETPVYSSTPISVGQDLAFNQFPKPIDLYLKDSEEDEGIEPNLITEHFWKSSSIWVRNQPDSIYSHENPLYSSDHQTAYIYVKVFNRGKEDYKGGKFLHIYWSQASTGLSAKTWKGREVYVNAEDGFQHATGGHLEPAYIPPLAAGTDTVIQFVWPLPRLLQNYPDQNFHFCLYGKIMETVYDDGYDESKRDTYFQPKRYNNEAQKNVTIIRAADLTKAFNVYVRNTNPGFTPYSLELQPHSEYDKNIFSHATIDMTLSPLLYDAWTRGGNKSTNVTLLSSPERRVRFNSSDSQLQSINLNTAEFDIVQLKFNFKYLTTKSITYTLDLIQRDENGTIIGGETFIVSSPQGQELGFPTLDLTSNDMGNNTYQLEVENEDSSYICWTNEKDDVISNDERIVVKGLSNTQTFTATAYREDGTIAAGTITLAPSYGIESWAIENNRQTLTINFFGIIPENAQICILSMQDNSQMVAEAEYVSENVRAVDISSLPNGYYAVMVISDDIVIDRKKIQL